MKFHDNKKLEDFRVYLYQKIAEGQASFSNIESDISEDQGHCLLPKQLKMLNQIL